MKFYGQQGEDMIAWELFKSSLSGFFVDVGAYDGVNSSNSLIFEQQGWNGICFEPNPALFAQLRANRKCILMNCIVGECVSKAEHFSINNAPALSKRSSEIDTSCLPMITLDYALSILSVDHVDYISIDVEGWERQVLWGFDILKYNPRLVIIEDITGDNGVYKYFEDNHYTLGRRQYFNALYLRDKSDIDTIATIVTNMENGKLMN